MNGNLDSWSNNLPTTLPTLVLRWSHLRWSNNFPDYLTNNYPTTTVSDIWMCVLSSEQKVPFTITVCNLQYWFIALSSISSAWFSKGPFSAMIILSKECCLIGCREESKCFSYRDTRLSTRLSTETFIHTTQIRWIITFLHKAVISFFRIDWIISLLSNIEG